jgi:hypothetical protein
MSYKRISITYIFCFCLLACSNSRFTLNENANSSFIANNFSTSVSYKEAIEKFKVNPEILRVMPRKDSLLLASWNLILNNKCQDAEKLLKNTNFVDSYNLLNTTNLLLYNCYYPEQQWKEIKDFTDTISHLKYMKSLSSFYDTFPSCSLFYANNIDSSVIPFTGNPHIYIYVWVKNKKYRFLFDSGTSGCIISSKLAKRLDNSCKFIEPSLLHDGAGNYANVYPALVPELRLGDVCISNLPVISSERMPSGCDGILGWSFLKKLRVTIDYNKKKLIFYKNHLPALENANLFGNELPFVICNLKKEVTSTRLLMLFDTGSDQTGLFTSNINIGDTLRFTNKRQITALRKITYSTSSIKSGSFDILLNKESVYFKNLEVRKQKKSTQYLELNGVLGSDLFRSGIVEFDFASNYFQFHR